VSEWVIERRGIGGNGERKEGSEEDRRGRGVTDGGTEEGTERETEEEGRQSGESLGLS
jgi:hypothetical protein